MKARTNYSEILGQLKQYSEQLNALIENGSFYRLPFPRRYLLIRRVKRMYNKLRGPVSEVRLRYILAGAAVMVVGFSCKPPAAPPKPPVIGFAAALQNPFGISPNSVSWSAPTFVDLDNDGDQDLFVGENGGNIQYFQNTGSASSPAFASPSVLKSAVGFAVPAFVDIDADGDFDLFVGEYDSSGKARLKYFPNMGTAASPSFPASTTSPFGLTTTDVLANPAFVDIDGDGDMDLFVGEYGGSIQYFQNTGSASLPAFAAPVASPYNLTNLYYYATPTFGDIDNDGDMDLFSGEKSQDIYYFENTTY